MNKLEALTAEIKAFNTEAGEFDKVGQALMIKRDLIVAEGGQIGLGILVMRAMLAKVKVDVLHPEPDSEAEEPQIQAAE